MMALERVPADIRRDGGVARMSDPKVHLKSVYMVIFSRGPTSSVQLWINEKVEKNWLPLMVLIID